MATAELRCPVCNGGRFEVVTPGTLRCTTERVVAGVPPGQAGNFSAQTIPITGPCNTVRSEDEWRAAAVAAASEAKAAADRAEAADARRRKAQEDAADLERRLHDALRELGSRGNPGLVPRRVPGRYNLTLTARVFGRTGRDERVEVEPAWPIGHFTWMRPGPRGTDIAENLRTGYTPTGRFVPMDHGTKGDAVELLYRQWKMPTTVDLPGLRQERVTIRQPSTADIVRALEAALAGRGSDEDVDDWG